MQPRKEQWLINSLRELGNTDKLNDYRASTREKINHGNTTRIFDDFDFLLPNDELMRLSKEYIVLLRHIHVFTDSNGEIANLNSNQIAVADSILAKIIRIAIFELFNKELQIRHELVEILHWDNLINKLQATDLLCAYAGSVFQTMYATYPKSLAEHAPGRQCAEKYINHHLRKITTAIQREAGFIIDNDATEFVSIFKTPTGIAAITAATLTFTSALVALGIYAYKSFSSHYNDSDSETNEKTDNIPPTKS